MTRNLILAFVVLVIALLLLYPLARARAQEHHDLNHDHYRNWMNKNGFGCCNNRDCGALSAENERVTVAGIVEVKIDNEWCPVLPHHYLRKGNAPDWSTSHVCISPYIYKGLSPCERLMCFQPRPGS